MALALLANAIAIGAALIALILAFGPISGAHLNPAVTLADAWPGGIAWRETPAYVVAQTAGAFASSKRLNVPLWTGSVTGCDSGREYTSLYIAVKVQRWSTTRSFNLLGILACLGLCICVFTWGLQYKLSLYDPPQAASHKIPQAKLLSKNERCGIAESPVVVRTKTSTRVSYIVPAAVLFFLFLALNILNPQTSRQRNRRTSSVCRLHRGLFNIFFVRPPPLLA
jgi:glycerol uptake facilitator-like aquaporin